MELVNNNIVCFYFSPISSHPHPLQVENCDSNSRLVVDEDDNGKFRPERVKKQIKTTMLVLRAQRGNIYNILHLYIFAHSSVASSGPI